MMEYVLGVDGGNSKTDFLLFDAHGNFIDGLKSGTCSHERFEEGFVRAGEELGKNISILLGRNGLTVNDVSSAAFGLAGIDLPFQQQKMGREIRKIGFRNFVAVNDSFLGIKAACESGYGVCSVNGTGTVTGGIDETGNWLQIGGIGYAFGDEAGGRFIARLAVRAAYDAFFRCGPQTVLCESLMGLFGADDKFSFKERAVEFMAGEGDPSLEIMKCLFSAAKEGDTPAVGVLEHVGRQLAFSAAGCINNLEFGAEVEVVLVGSVWVKADTPIMLDTFRLELAHATHKTCKIHALQTSPASGAVLWALERLNKKFPDMEMKRRIISRSVL